MRTQTRIQAMPQKLAVQPAMIEEFIEDHMSESEFLLDELEEKWLVEKDKYMDDEEHEDLEEWLQSLYGRGVNTPL